MRRCCECLFLFEDFCATIYSAFSIILSEGVKARFGLCTIIEEEEADWWSSTAEGCDDALFRLIESRVMSRNIIKNRKQGELLNELKMLVIMNYYLTNNSL